MDGRGQGGPGHLGLGEVALILMVGIAAPVLPRYMSLGNVDPAINRVDPNWIRWLGAPLVAAGLAMAVWGVR